MLCAIAGGIVWALQSVRDDSDEQGEETRITAAFSIRLRVDHSVTWLVMAPPGQPALAPRRNAFVSIHEVALPS
jgi:hypothetical protein